MSNFITRIEKLNAEFLRAFLKTATETGQTAYFLSTKKDIQYARIFVMNHNFRFGTAYSVHSKGEKFMIRDRNVFLPETVLKVEIAELEFSALKALTDFVNKEYDRRTAIEL